MKKVIAFDLDDTLAISKSPISDRMSTVLGELVKHFDVCVISGGKFEQFKLQVIQRLNVEEKFLTKLHMLPTCGTRYYTYEPAKKDWVKRYSEDLSAEQKREIIEVLEEEASKIDLKNKKTWGPIIEDRESQISYSILGQQAPPDEKYRYAAEHAELKKEFHSRIVPRLPNLEVRLGGATTIDITKLGIDKAYGMNKLMQALKIGKEDILFFGDKLQEGGNDYPVKAMDIDCLEVGRWEDTVLALEAILHIL